MEPEIVKLEPNNRVSMSMSLYNRIKSIAFCKECGCAIGACDCAGLAAFTLDEKYYLLDLFDRYKGKTKMAAGIKILVIDIVEATDKAENLKD